MATRAVHTLQEQAVANERRRPQEAEAEALFEDDLALFEELERHKAGVLGPHEDGELEEEEEEDWLAFEDEEEVDEEGNVVHRWQTVADDGEQMHPAGHRFQSVLTPVNVADEEEARLMAAAFSKEQKSELGLAKDAHEYWLLRRKFGFEMPANVEAFESTLMTEAMAARFEDVYHAIMRLPSNPALVESTEDTQGLLRAEASRELQEDETHGLVYWKTRPRDTAAYTKLMRLYGAVGRLDEAERQLETMEEEGLVADVMTYTALMRGYAEGGDADGARSLLKRMIGQSVAPSTWTFAALMQAYVRAGQVDKAERVLPELALHGLEPDNAVMTVLVSGWLERGEVERAWTLFDTLRQRFEEPDVVLFTSMIKACAVEGNVERALNLLDDLYLVGGAPTQVTYNALFHACAARPDYEDTLERLFAQAKEEGLRPDVVTLNTLLNAYAEAGRVDKAMEVVKVAEEDWKVQPDAVSAATLLKCYANRMLEEKDGQARKLLLAATERTIDGWPELHGDSRAVNTMLSVYTRAVHLRTAESKLQMYFAVPEAFRKALNLNEEDGSSTQQRERAKMTVHTVTMLVQMYVRAKRHAQVAALYDAATEHGLVDDKLREHVRHALRKTEWAGKVEQESTM